MTRFDDSVLANDPVRRRQVLAWLEKALQAVDPVRLTRDALRDGVGEEGLVLAIGKAAPAMARGAAAAMRITGGICVSDHPEPVPRGVELILGDHPLPGANSFEAGRAVIDFLRSAPPDRPLVALISGGGSALCEAPRQGVSSGYLMATTETLIRTGATITEINLVREHLSSIKGGGLARAAGRPIPTYVISDVGGAEAGIVASGPTVPHSPDPDGARQVMLDHDIEVPPSVWNAMSTRPDGADPPPIRLLADGFDAARAVCDTAPDPVVALSGWLGGDVGVCLDRFLESGTPGVTVGVGETVVSVKGNGLGGRNTHACLLAARRLAGSDTLFTAFATDGVDGQSMAAGGIVDGQTIGRAGSPEAAIENFDSATYLRHSGDLLSCPPTGTNVSDIWILWRNPGSST